jgi:hypothetical protein
MKLVVRTPFWFYLLECVKQKFSAVRIAPVLC